MYRTIERGFNRLVVLYEKCLRFCLRHRLATVCTAGLMAVLTVVWARLLPQGFIPTDDIGQISISTEAAQDISFDEMVRHQRAAAEIVAANPSVEAFMSSVSSSPFNPGP